MSACAEAIWARIGLGVLAAGYTAIGGWALLAPSSFFTDFPAPGLGWVAGLPPYNQHLLTDFGGSQLGRACVLWLAAVVAERRLVRVALVVPVVLALALLWSTTRRDAATGPARPAAVSGSNR